MNRASQIRMTNDEIQRNTECRIRPLNTQAPFDIQASDFFRHLSFVIRHQVHGPNAFAKAKGALHELETLNIERRTPNAKRCGPAGRYSMFDVRRSMFSLSDS